MSLDFCLQTLFSAVAVLTPQQLMLLMLSSSGQLPPPVAVDTKTPRQAAASMQLHQQQQPKREAAPCGSQGALQMPPAPGCKPGRKYKVICASLPAVAKKTIWHCYYLLLFYLIC